MVAFLPSSRTGPDNCPDTPAQRHDPDRNDGPQGVGERTPEGLRTQRERQGAPARLSFIRTHGAGILDFDDVSDRYAFAIAPHAPLSGAAMSARRYCGGRCSASAENSCSPMLRG
eukprot:gene3701-biopygen4453